MAMTLLEEWGIRTCQDVGEIVFTMVEHKLLKKTDKDSRADFENGHFDRLGAECAQAFAELARLMRGAGNKDPPADQREERH